MVEHGGGAVLDRVLAFFEGLGEVVVGDSLGAWDQPGDQVAGGRAPAAALAAHASTRWWRTAAMSAASCSDRAAISCGSAWLTLRSLASASRSAAVSGP